mgnify:CR=1 FL=1
MKVTFWVDVPDPCPPLRAIDIMAAWTRPRTYPPTGDERRFMFTVDFPVALTTDAEVVAATAPEEVKP